MTTPDHQPDAAVVSLAEHNADRAVHNAELRLAVLLHAAGRLPPTDRGIAYGLVRFGLEAAPAAVARMRRLIDRRG